MTDTEPPAALVRQCERIAAMDEGRLRDGLLLFAKEVLHHKHERGEINDEMKRRLFEILNLPT